MMRRALPPPEERCPRSRCIRKRAVVDGKLLETCAAHLGKGRSRYGVKRVKDSTGREYQSKAEREGMAEFRLKEKAGHIRIIGEQVVFTLCIDPHSREAFVRCAKLGLGELKTGRTIERYHADVVWKEGGRLRVGDFKRGLMTRDFTRKAAWMGACGWPVEILRR